MCAILPLICFAVGGEAKRLHSFIKATRTKNSALSAPSEIQSAINLYLRAGVEMAGWEQCIDWETMLSEGFEPKACLTQLRTEVRHSYKINILFLDILSHPLDVIYDLFDCY